MKRLAQLRAVVVLALSYLIAAKLGLTLASVNEYTTAVWPSAGIALAAPLVWGYRLWPGILLGAYLVNRFANGRRVFLRARDVFRFAIGAALAPRSAPPSEY